MRAHPERLLKKYLDQWIRLFGLGSWRITYEVVDVLEDDNEEWLADVEPTKRRSGYKKAHLRFSLGVLTTPAFIETQVIHELLHIVQHGAGNDGHRLVYRLSPKLRLVRIRASRKR